MKTTIKHISEACQAAETHFERSQRLARRTRKSIRRHELC